MALCPSGISLSIVYLAFDHSGGNYKDLSDDLWFDLASWAQNYVIITALNVTSEKDGHMWIWSNERSKWKGTAAQFVILNCQYEILKCQHKAMAFFFFFFSFYNDSLFYCRSNCTLSQSTVKSRLKMVFLKTPTHQINWCDWPDTGQVRWKMHMPEQMKHELTDSSGSQAKPRS